MTDPALDPQEPPPEPGIGAEPPPLPRFEASIVPRATIAGRALVAVIAIMTFLGSLTICAVVLVAGWASDWEADVAREVTIQVRPAAGRDLEADVGAASAIARGVRGIAEVRPYSKQESAVLLEPWLGRDLKLEDLPIPRIVAVRIAAGAAPDFGQLRRTLAAQVPPASLDDHREFVSRMRLVSRTAAITGAGVLALVIISTVLSVAFATRGVMATNRQVIEVLHFIGAKDRFIAGHFQRHFLLLGLKGGLVGGGSAIVLLAGAGLASVWLAGSPAAGQLGALFGTLSTGFSAYAAVLAQAILIAVVTAAASRRTVRRTLEAIR